MAWSEQMQSADWTRMTVCLCASYALGCFTTGYYLVRAWLGRDIRDMDSGSVGAKNVGRVLGKKGFLLTLLGDLCKGAFAVWAARHYSGSNLIAGLAMLAVVAGHIWPVQLWFRGGKGASTSLSALLVWDYRIVLAFLAIFLAAFAVTRKTVLPGLFAFACLPLATLWLTREGTAVTIVLALASMVLFAHRKNFVEEIPALAARRGVEPKPEHPKI
jgi:acyl phosphate:glycerol-3-phosphate acyltransferase